MAAVQRGPFALGDHVLVYDHAGLFVIDEGTIVGELAPLDGEYAYDIAGEKYHHAGTTEMLLELSRERSAG